MDFYGLLGLSRSASSSEIKAAFKKKAVEHHPDKHVGSSEHDKLTSSQKFKAISEAYETLSNDTKRRAYDLSSRYGAGAASSYGRSRSQQSYQQHPYYTEQQYAYAGRGSQQYQQQGFARRGFWSAFKVFSKSMTRGDAYFHLLLAGCAVGGTLFAQGIGESLWQRHNSGKLFEDIQRRKAAKPTAAAEASPEQPSVSASITAPQQASVAAAATEVLAPRETVTLSRLSASMDPSAVSGPQPDSAETGSVQPATRAPSSSPTSSGTLSESARQPALGARDAASEPGGGSDGIATPSQLAPGSGDGHLVDTGRPSAVLLTGEVTDTQAGS